MRFRWTDIIALIAVLAFFAAWTWAAKEEAEKGGQWPIPGAGKPL